jgi:cation diffusion facilitator CzcD-associated flavoprotein CzcO
LEERLAASEDPIDEIFKVVIFEQNSKAGGVWNQTKADVQFATPMYPACTSIVPTDMMRYSDFPYQEETALFPKNPSLARYLHAYARDLEERGTIEYNTEVIKVCRRLTAGPNQLKWEVEIRKGGLSGLVSFSRFF